LVWGCGGGGGGGASSGSLTVTSFVLLPSQTGTFSVLLGFSAPNGDLSAMTSVLYDASGKTLGSSTTTVTGSAGRTSGSLQSSYNFSSLPPGDYRVEIFLSDGKG